MVVVLLNMYFNINAFAGAATLQWLPFMRYTFYKNSSFFISANSKGGNVHINT